MLGSLRGGGGRWHLLDYASPSVGGRWPVAVVAPVRCSGGRAPAKRPVPERTMDRIRIRSYVMDQCAQCEGGRAMVTFVKHIDTLTTNGHEHQKALSISISITER